jgi:hypothetical protein
MPAPLADLYIPISNTRPELRAAADRLRDRTHTILCATLEYHGTVISKRHREALHQLCDCLADTAVHVRGGRRVMPLPTGAGKTSAIVALCKAVHEQNPVDANGNPVSVSVCASQIRHLQNLVRDMVAAGVPREWIGIKYGEGKGVDDTVPSTGDVSHRIQLVTHQRLRTEKKSDLPLYTMHGDKPRSVCIYDESWMSYSQRTLTIHQLRQTYKLVVDETSKNPVFALARDHIVTCHQRVNEAINKPDPLCVGVEVVLPELTKTEQMAYKKALMSARLPGSLVRYVEDLLSLSGETMRACALPGGTGGGALWIDLAISPSVQNVVVLDASYPIRPLTNLSSDLWSADPGFAAIKDWSEVDVTVLKTSGARGALEKVIEGSAQRRTANAFAAEVVAEVRKVWDTTRGCLIFSYKQQGEGRVNMVRTITEALQGAGMDFTNPETFVNGKPRVVVETFGNEASINLYSYCDHVLFAGLLHLSDLTISAGIKAAKGDIAYATPMKMVSEVLLCERASTLFQGLSRGHSRVMNNGKAGKMSVVVFDSAGPELEQILRPVMPGAKWTHVEPTHLSSSKAQQRGHRQEMQTRILGYLRALDPSVTKVSARALKKDLGLDTTSIAVTRAFVDAGESLPRGCGWFRIDRSFCRTDSAEAHGFLNEELMEAATAF